MIKEPKGRSIVRHANGGTHSELQLNLDLVMPAAPDGYRRGHAVAERDIGTPWRVGCHMEDGLNIPLH